MSKVHDEVKEYYGKELQTSADLKTNACCTLEAPANHIMEALRLVHDEVQSKYYGCGLTIPTEMKGLKVLDLGSGSGRDCYIAGKLVGESGEVIGVDMTDEQLEVANKYIDHHAKAFGYRNSNVSFYKGNIEQLDQLGFEPGTFDLIISNCVINLAEDKQKVLNDTYSLLKVGGEMYFSDVYSDRRVSETLQKDPVLWGECLSGALYWNDFLTFSKRAGFVDPRAVESKPITVENKELQEKLGNITFFSVTYRLFKLPAMDSDCEEYGQSVKYNGTLLEEPNGMLLDDHHYFEKDRMMSVCGNTYRMLNETRYKKHFDFFGDFNTHYGIFEGCGGAMPFSTSTNTPTTDSASCC